MRELNAVDEIRASYHLVKSDLMDIVILEHNLTEHQSHLDMVNKSLGGLIEIEKQPFEQLEEEIGEEETSEEIYESWEELNTKHTEIIESIGEEQPFERTMIPIMEAMEIGEHFERILDQRLESENEELEERANNMQETTQTATDFIYLVAVVAILFSIGAGTLISRSISNPIRILIHAARQISAGNFNIRLTNPKGDEIEELFTQFREMSEKVRLSNEYLNTQIKSKTRELELANAELKRKDRLKDEFISIASHELKTPVHPILELAEAAKEGLIGHEKAWDLLYKHAKRLQRLTNDILDVSRIESGQLSYQFERLQINDIIKNVTSQASINSNKDVRFEVMLDREVEIFGDKDRLNQVFANMIENASKFTERGKITIESRVIDEKKAVEIKISDTGVGIPYDILPEIFDKFVTKGDSGGTGLGLFICKAIITAHGGKISANNNQGGGATFTIILPIITGNKEEGSSKTEL
jgi:signal transduction histidine kinase